MSWLLLLLLLRLHLSLLLLSLLLGLELRLPLPHGGRAGPPLLDEGLLPFQGLDAQRHPLLVGAGTGTGGAGRRLRGQRRHEGRRRSRMGLDGRRRGRTDGLLLCLLLLLLLLLGCTTGRRYSCRCGIRYHSHRRRGSTTTGTTSSSRGRSGTCIRSSRAGTGRRH